MKRADTYRHALTEAIEEPAVSTVRASLRLSTERLFM